MIFELKLLATYLANAYIHHFLILLTTQGISTQVTLGHFKCVIIKYGSIVNSRDRYGIQWCLQKMYMGIQPAQTN